MCECKLKKSDLSLLSGVLDEYAKVEGSLITILQKAQEIYGYLPIDVIYHIAESTGNSPAKVLGVATFYTQFRLQPIGKYLIMQCQGTACHVNGSERIAAAITEELGIRDGETTEDGLFSLELVNCLGSCALAPVMVVDDTYYGKMTMEKLPGVLDSYRKEG